MNLNLLSECSYILAIAFFILSLKWLSGPTTAKRGVLVGEIGAALALVTTLATTFPETPFSQFKWILIALFVGMIIGIPLGMVQMTAVPQRTALSHAFGALAAALIGIAEYYMNIAHITRFEMVEISLEVIIGSLSFTGSLIAAGKLQEVLPQRPIVYKGQNYVSLSVLGAALLLALAMVISPAAAVAAWLFPAMVVISLLFGVLLVTPIGGADMPTVIALLNSYVGLTAALLGFVLNSKVLVVAGALDGSSGFVLAVIMCKAMNRSFTNVVFGAFGQLQTSAAGEQVEKTVRSALPEEAAAILGTANSVIIVPGYGMAAAQAQHKVRELSDALISRGVDVKFAIHPVAGRMPGHMNVLLAEAEIPYDRMVEMDDINGDFPQCDVALVIGANDVVNPAARHDKSSPIYGMPIIDADKARTVMAIKRSMKPGFAGIENELYYAQNCLMIFGDAKAVVGSMAKELAESTEAVAA